MSGAAPQAAAQPTEEVRLEPCPLCDDMMEVSIGLLIRHVVPGDCLLGDLGWPVEFASRWNTRFSMFSARAAEELARKFYEAVPAGAGMTRVRHGRVIASERFSWEEAQDTAAPYVADLRRFAQVALRYLGVMIASPKGEVK